MTKKLTYTSSGVNYETLDPIKKLAQEAASSTAKNLRAVGFVEKSETRGESAFVWKQGNVYMAGALEHLGTKNLVADAMRKITGKTYYDIMGYDAIATIVNDLITVGARPLVIQAYWAVGNSQWLEDQERMRDLIKGWKKGCNDSGAAWSGGETTTCPGIIEREVIDLAGSAVGIIQKKSHLITEDKLKTGDRILLLKSNGLNANGLTLARAIAKKLPQSYATKLTSGKLYGEALLTKTNIYVRVIQALLNNGVDVHYISNITGHGLRKIMRARQNFTYVIEKLFTPQAVFHFIQKQARLSDYEMCQTFNLGQDYAIFLPAKQVEKAQRIIRQHKFQSLEAGWVEEGEREVVLVTKNIVYKGETLDLR